MILNFIILIIAEISMASAVIFIKLSTSNSLILATYRLLIAAVLLTPVFFRQYKAHRYRYSIKDIKLSVIPGILLSLHFISWITGAKMTLASNATIIINMIPAVMPFISIALLKEKPHKWEIIGTILAILGMTFLIIMDFHFSGTSFKGDILCFISMLLFGVYILLARKNKQIPSIWLYVVPLYYIAGLFTLIISLFFINPFKIPLNKNIVFIIALAVVPTIFGHSLLNYSMKHFRGQTISIFGQLQFLFASVMAFFILHEAPKTHLYISSIFMIGGSIITILDYGKGKSKEA